MGYYSDKVRRTADRAKADDRDPALTFKAACLTNIAIACEADEDVARLKSALKAIAGDAPWPDPEMGYVDLARQALSAAHSEESD